MKTRLTLMLWLVLAWPALAQVVNYPGSASSGGGGATNGIQMLNGSGTNTVLHNLNVISAAGAYPGDITGSAATATTTTNAGTYESLLYPAHVGVAQSTGNYATAANNSGFCYIPGSGVVRALWTVPVISLQWTNTPTPNLSIQCYVDVGSNTNPPTAALKAFEIPLMDLLMANYRFPSNGNYSTSFDSRFLSITDYSTNVLMQHPIRTVLLKTPMYFTNGIMFRITNTVSANNTWTNGYFTASYERGAISSPFADWRLRTLRYSGTITASTSNYLGKVASGGAFVVGQIQSALADDGTGDFVNFTDSHGVRITQGGSGGGLFWELNGDDAFNGTYGFVRGQFAELDYGAPNVLFDPSVDPTLTRAGESYRWFYQDHMVVTNGFVASVTPNGGLIGYKLNLFYYAP